MQSCRFRTDRIILPHLRTSRISALCIVITPILTSRSGLFFESSVTMPAVMAPSRIPRGSWVGMKAITIFPKSGRKAESPRMPEASSTDVMR